MSDTKTFWQIVKPLFSNKVKAKTIIKLVENNEMMIAKLFNEYFLSLKERTCQTKKNAFYFTSKALLILEKIKF